MICPRLNTPRTLGNVLIPQSIIRRLTMIFIKNKYTKWYNSIIDNAIGRPIQDGVYYERHHVLPKSMGGSNDKTNLVPLTAKEHFICHMLLPKMTTGDARISMLFAAFTMATLTANGNQRYKVNSNTYEILRKFAAEATRKTHTGKVESAETRAKKSKALKGRPSPTKGMVAWNRGIPMTAAAKAKASAKIKAHHAANPHPALGIPKTEEMKKHLSDKTKGIPKEKVTCPHCNKTGGRPAMTRHHFDNCKSKHLDVTID